MSSKKVMIGAVVGVAAGAVLRSFICSGKRRHDEKENGPQDY